MKECLKISELFKCTHIQKFTNELLLDCWTGKNKGRYCNRDFIIGVLKRAIIL